MGNKKMGRPTNNPKTISFKVLLDNDTSIKLNECIKKLKVSKAEVVRQGISKVYTDLPK